MTGLKEKNTRINSLIPTVMHQTTEWFKKERGLTSFLDKERIMNVKPL
jgi:hypothetical protein